MSPRRARSAEVAPPLAEPDEPDPSLVHLRARLALLDQRIHRLVAHRRITDPSPDDAFRGLYLADHHIAAVLEADPADRGLPPSAPDHAARGDLERDADRAEEAGADLRLRRLGRSFELDDADLDVLLAALVPDLDGRYERLYGYLNDDVSRRRCSVELALHLAGLDPLAAADRARLAPGGVLARSGLVIIADDRPFLGRDLTVPDRVTAHLFGSDEPDASLRGIVVADAVGWGDDEVMASVATAISVGALPLHVRDGQRGAARPAVLAGLAVLGVEPFVIDLDRLARQPDVLTTLATAVREARLRGAALVAGPIDAIASVPGAVAVLVEAPAAVVITGRERWDAALASAAPTELVAGPPTPAARLALWQEVLGDAVADPSPLGTFRLAPDAVVRAATSARLRAAVAGENLSVEHVLAGARAQNTASLEALARRIEPAVGLDDMVVTPAARELLDDLVNRARCRDTVLDDWGMRPGGGRGRGINALFAGDPGTGKTMAAEAVARALGLDLYAVDLASVVDKYIGETEKNLERIFAEAEGVNGVLLFDEADALFGKRSEVSDAHDRHANIEVAYLLQRMEVFDGVAILATNLRANLDEAFARRLDVVVDFQLPDEAQRRVLWDRCLGSRIPRAADLDLEFCAKAFELAGGSIRAIAVTAAYRAAAHARAVEMSDLIAATNTEYRKLGRMVHEREFGAWAAAGR